MFLTPERKEVFPRCCHTSKKRTHLFPSGLACVPVSYNKTNINPLFVVSVLMSQKGTPRFPSLRSAIVINVADRHVSQGADAAHAEKMFCSQVCYWIKRTHMLRVSVEGEMESNNKPLVYLRFSGMIVNQGDTRLHIFMFVLSNLPIFLCQIVFLTWKLSPVLMYFNFLLIYKSTSRQFRGKWCTFYHVYLKPLQI